MFGAVRTMLLGAALAATVAGVLAQERECGFSLNDWCVAAGDPCGRHRNAGECRADFNCYGVPFRGKSTVACLIDRRGFSQNCPTVGCRSQPHFPGR